MSRLAILLHVVVCCCIRGALLGLGADAQNEHTTITPPPGIFTTDASFAADTHEIVEDARETDTYTLQELETAAPGFRNRLKPFANPTGEYRMRPVRVVHARAVADMPVYDSIYNRFISSLGSRIDAATSVKGFTAAMDTVTTSSVDGAMLFLQTEVVNQFGRTAATRCRRKNDIQFIVFYELLIAQPNASLALFQSSGINHSSYIPEYGPFVAMDHGRCTPLQSQLGEDSFPDACYQFNGNHGRARVGPFVGAALKDHEMRGAYKDAYWFSFPNACPLQPWTAKTQHCRSETQRGLCPPGKLPDGVACTYTYNILGFLPLDDLVGITSMANDLTGRPFVNFSEFCRVGNVEFAAFDKFGYVLQTLPFWQFPLDPQANANRTQRMLDAYQQLVGQRGHSPQIYPKVREKMQPLPTVDELREQNPPCYETVAACGRQRAALGCKRETLAQICRVCAVDEKGCVRAPATFAFPALAKPELSADGSGSGRSGGVVDPPRSLAGTARCCCWTAVILLAVVWSSL